MQLTKNENDQYVVAEEPTSYFSTLADEISDRTSLSFSEDAFTMHPSLILMCSLSPKSQSAKLSLENLNSSKSTGWDLIPSRVLKLAAKEL